MINSFQGFDARGTLINTRWRTRLFLGYAIQRDMFSPVPPVETLANTRVMYDAIKKCPSLNITVIKSRIRREVEQEQASNDKLASRCDGSNAMTSDRTRNGSALEDTTKRRDGSKAVDIQMKRDGNGQVNSVERCDRNNAMDSQIKRDGRKAINFQIKRDGSIQVESLKRLDRNSLPNRDGSNVINVPFDRDEAKETRFRINRDGSEKMIPPMKRDGNDKMNLSKERDLNNIDYSMIERHGDSVRHSRIKRDVSKPSVQLDKSFALRMCDSPNVYMKSRIEYKTIYKAIDDNNLMTAEQLKAVCRLETKIMRSFPKYEKRCFKRNITISGRLTEICCPSWSLGNYIAALSWKPSCQDIDQNDVASMTKRLQKCAGLYNNQTLKENCWDYNNAAPYPYCVGIPIECIQYNAVFNILYYLTDKDFYGKAGDTKLTYALVLTPRWTDSPYSKQIFFTYIKDKTVTDDNVELVGSDFFNLKFHMFNKNLLGDLIYPSIALMIILIIMWFYTESLLLTFLLSVSVLSALILAYFFYMIVLRLDFFPFLNVTTLIFLVGIGADDAFVYTDVWRQAKQEHPGASLTDITSYTLKHASLSMFVTSLTTAGAFIANFSNEITTIKLFGLYAGIAILAKFSLMVTWFPAVCVINELYCARLMNKTAGLNWLSKCRVQYEKTFTRMSRYVFDDFLPRLVIRFKYAWLVLYTILTALGLFVLLGYPGLQLPTSSDFQIFAASHPLEKYDIYLKDKFRFELSPSQESATFPIDLFWGIEQKDYGDFLNPYSYGKFGWDPDFEIESPESQKWLMDFCQRIRQQDFYAEKLGSEKKCFIEVFYNQSCSDPLLPELCNYPCCKNTSFPFSNDVLNYCAISSAYRQKTLKYSVQESSIGSFIYNPAGKLLGIWIRIRSNVRMSRAYEPAHRFWNRIESWVQREMSTAPPGLRKGWFISNVEFYNLQRSLSRGTLFSLSISIATTFSVMVLTTANLFVSLYAILTIIGIIAVTIGSLVLNGWKLNILESITMSVAVGVSIDFAMHFGVAYCLAPDKNCRTSRVRYSLSRMGSAISMAAVTTFIAGNAIDNMPKLFAHDKISLSPNYTL